MFSEIEKAVKLLTGKIDQNVKSDDALRYTQAVLNLSHAFITLKNAEKV
jgi:hypothetical protein